MLRPQGRLHREDKHDRPSYVAHSRWITWVWHEALSAFNFLYEIAFPRRERALLGIVSAYSYGLTVRGESANAWTVARSGILPLLLR